MGDGQNRIHALWAPLRSIVALVALTAALLAPASAIEAATSNKANVGIPCTQVSDDTRLAIEALLAYGPPTPKDASSSVGAAVAPVAASGPSAAAPNAIQPRSDGAELVVLRRLNALLVSGDFGSDSLCPVLPVDRAFPAPADDRLEPPPGSETLLTAAIKTCKADFIQTVLKIEKSVNGNVYATAAAERIGIPAPKPVSLFDGCSPPTEGNQGWTALRSQLDPNVIYAPWSSRSTTHTWERFQAEGNSGAIAPDVDDVPRRFPAYLTSLIAAQQGLSVGASSQSGSTSPKIQGELRYTIGQTETDHQDDRTGQDDGYVGRSFFWAGGNLSSSKNYAQPNNPKWVGTGIGYKEILGASPLFWTDSRARWIEVRSKFGDEYNLLPTLHSNYVVTNVATSYFFALASDLDGKYPLRTGAPAYGAVSVGGQAQARTAGVSDSGVRSAYTFERLDLYVYPLWAFSRLFGTSADGPPNAACFSRVTGSEIDWIKAGCSIVTLHIDRQIVNNGLGALNEFAVNWGFRKGLSLSFTRSVGTPDPISNFGLKMTKTATSQLALKLTPGQ